MTATTGTSLYDLAAELLASSAAALAATPGGAPARQYVSLADPVWDCEQVVVHVPRMEKLPYGAAGSAGDPQHRLRTTTVNLVTFTVTVVRCVPSPSNVGPPDAAALSASAALTYQDGWTLWNYLTREIRNGVLWSGYPTREVVVGPLIAANTSGGLGGWLLNMQAELGGYVP